MEIPNIIYLQWDESGEGVTWCIDKINETDIAYIRLTPVAADAEQQQALGDDEPRAAEHDG